jgi:hypothetical protein
MREKQPMGSLVVCDARIGENMARKKSTLIHDPVVISSGAISSETTRGIALVVGIVTLSIGAYVAYGSWKENAR